MELVKDAALVDGNEIEARQLRACPRFVEDAVVAYADKSAVPVTVANAFRLHIVDELVKVILGSTCSAATGGDK